MKSYKFELLDILRDKVSGFRGVCLARGEQATGCVVYGIAPQKLDKSTGKLLEWEWLAENRLEKVGQLKGMVVPAGSYKFAMFDVLRDRVTGFEGVCVSRNEYSTGSRHYSLQSKTIVAADGKPKDWVNFDETNLEKAGSIPVFPGYEKEERSGQFPNPPRLVI